VRIRFDQSGKPTSVEPFLTGFLVKGGAPEGKDGHFARLAGIAVGRDGSLLISDDTNNIIYRVSYGQGDLATLAGRQIITSLLSDVQAIPGTIAIRSSAFSQNQSIPDANSAYGQNQSPELSWSGVPAGAKSLVLMLEDPDAFSPKPVWHWLVANIPSNISSLPSALAESEKLTQIGNAIQGGNFTGKLGYFGPRPPAGDPPHHYHFQIFALDTALQLPAGFNRQALIKAMRGHVIAKGELVGTYQRKP
ncbi:MAG TPA: YbhB/YbcL family Raf kinase inhibitor-like protein, partial [Blastocatellia bacterium]|nr:YbhB/YbcL family Raf kinase inhibitor-like protein [Blastocatellia bacterium]